MADYSNVFPSYNDTYVAADQQWNLILNVLFINFRLLIRRNYKKLKQN